MSRLVHLLVLLAVISCSWAQSAESYYRQLSSLIEDHQLAEAVETGEKALEEHPRDLRLQVTMAALMLRLNELNRAALILDSALEQGVLDPELLLVASRVQAGLGRLDAALSTLEVGLKARPERHDLWYYRSQFLYRGGKLEEAAESARDAVRLAPHESRYRRFHALLLEQLGRGDEALEELRILFRQDSADAPTLLKMADQARHQNRRAQAMEYLELARSIDPENPIYPSELAPIYEELGLSEEARQARADANSLELAFASLQEAVALRSKNRDREAIDVLETQIQKTPSFHTGASFLADLYVRSGRTEEALELYTRVIRGGGSSPAVREASAWIHLQKGDWKEAMQVLESGEESSRNLELFESYGLAARGDWRGAAERAQALEHNYPLSTDLLQQISYFLYRAGDSREALRYLERAYQVTGGDAMLVERARQIRFEHALKLQAEEKWEEALEVLERLYLEEQRADYLFRIGYARQQLEQYEEAAAAYVRGLSLNPEGDWARVNLARCLYFLFRFDEAARQWEYLLARSDSSEYRYRLGVARIRQWRLEEGWGLVEEAARGGHEDACRLLGAAGRKLDRFPECPTPE